MTPFILELNDTGLRLMSVDGVICQSPAYVTIDQRHTYIGEDSFARSKLMPTRTENNFWERLSLDPLPRTYTSAKTYADLAYLHLESVAEHVSDGAPVWIAVPCDFSRDQLALILGMGKRLGLNIQALVDLGLAACPSPAPGRKLYHLDLHLHRSVLTHFEQGPWLERTGQWSSPEFGLARLQDTWAHAVSQIFVRHSRFDPLHQAEVEQLLYDQLSGWHQSLQDDQTVEIELKHDGRRYEAKLSRQELLEAAEPLYRRLYQFVASSIEDTQVSRLQISDRAAQLPGLVDKLNELPGCELQVLEQNVVSNGVQRIYLQRQSDDSGVSYVTRKPWFSSETLKQHDSALSGQQRRQPTHVLYNAVAHRLNSQSFAIAKQIGDQENGLALGDLVAELDHHKVVLGQREGQLILLENAANQVWINHKPAKLGQSVTIGDRLRLGAQGTELMLIAVDDHGS